jgi:hypothetical protein
MGGANDGRGRMATYYHGTDDYFCEGETMDAGGCVTDSYDAACQYGATVYEVRVVEGGRWADAEELVEAAQAVDVWTEGAWLFELADDCDVREELARRGFAGVVYEDSTPENKACMTCCRAVVDGAMVVVGAIE